MFSMATITVNVPDKVAKAFRKQVRTLHGKKKGVLGKAMTEAMQDWMAKHPHYKEVMELLEKGWDAGEFTMPTRDEMHGRD